MVKRSDGLIHEDAILVVLWLNMAIDKSFPFLIKPCKAKFLIILKQLRNRQRIDTKPFSTDKRGHMPNNRDNEIFSR